jgi:hypothetical protein
MSISHEGNAYLQVTFELLHSLLLFSSHNKYSILMLSLNVRDRVNCCLSSCAIYFVANCILAALQGKPFSLLPCYENCCWDCISSCLFIGAFHAIFHSWGKITSFMFLFYWYFVYLFHWYFVCLFQDIVGTFLFSRSEGI